jgi:hypothetical protein
MKGIYLTQEGKQELEAKIVELEKLTKGRPREFVYKQVLQLDIYKEILSSATILPVEKSFYAVEDKLKHHCGRTGCSKDDAIFKEYLNGVIIQPKQ